MSDCTDWGYLNLIRILIIHKKMKKCQELNMPTDTYVTDLYKASKIAENYNHCKLFRKNEIVSENVKLCDLEGFQDKMTLVFEVKSILSK